MLKAAEVADLGADAGGREGGREWAGGRELRQRRLERSATVRQRLDRTEIVEERRLRGEVVKAQLRKPAPVLARPRPRRAGKAQLPPTQEVGEPVTGAHQVAAQVLARTHEIT